jgi:hypothetical protein
MRLPALLVACVVAPSALLVVPDVRADETLKENAWGLYAGPTTYELTHSSSEYNRATSGTSLDFGVYYTRFVTTRFSWRVEGRVTSRHVDIAVPLDVPAGGASEAIARIDERFFEIPLILQADRRSRLGESEIRISAGAGVCYGVLIGQDLMILEDRVSEDVGAGGYKRLSFLFDGGATLDVTTGDSVFLRFRAQYDAYVFGEDDEVRETTEYFSYGFYAGFESPF